MACVIVPIAEAVIVSAILKKVERREAGAAPGDEPGWAQRLRWLRDALWGGAFLLIVEHVWHGEIVPWPPFLTAMQSAAETEAMLHEMATVGVSMALLVTGVWLAAALFAGRRRPARTAPAQ
jgi:hypothetical protein